MKINKVFSIFLLCTGVAYAADYQGRVVDIDGIEQHNAEG